MTTSLGQRLARARTEAAISLDELARRAGVDAAALARFERGEAPLTAAKAIKLARTLGLPPSMLLHTSMPVAAAPVAPSVLLRQMAGVAWLDDADRDALADAVLRARGFQELGKLVGHDDLAGLLVPSPAPAERPHLSGYSNAQALRARLMRPRAPLPNLRRFVEDRLGILVTRHVFADASVSGAAVRAGAARAIVIANRPMRETALRFTLAHELAHHLMDLGEEDARADQGELEQRDVVFERTPLEKRANAFAAMFLAPAEGVKELLGAPAGNAGLELARRMAEQVSLHFGLGITASIRHLNDLGYYDESAADFLVGHAEGPTVSGFEEEPRFDGLERRVFFALEREDISMGRARELIGERVHDFVRAAT
jgi:Zn-dependent peptidase ImmA (M78 family)/transcriptional regulator with XRE-family HTH domain